MVPDRKRRQNEKVVSLMHISLDGFCGGPNGEIAWNNTTLYRGDMKNVIARLKKEPGVDMMIFGSPRVTHAFMDLDLIDEYRLQINPILVDDGIQMFKNIKQHEKLKLVSSNTFQSGVLAVHHQRG